MHVTFTVLPVHLTLVPRVTRPSAADVPCAVNSAPIVPETRGQVEVVTDHIMKYADLYKVAETVDK